MYKKFEDIVARIGRVVFGKENEIRLCLTCLFAGGHLLIEDRPGIGKTTLAKVLAKCLGLDFTRIQYTSDMLPGDILGVSVFEQSSNAFVFHPGPVFTQILLADEINRATPKTQSSLLEAMEEKQVTIEGKTYPLKSPFFVIATQNPLEQSGTFPLPESQLDRFLMRISIGYPDRKAERRLLKRGETKDTISEIAPVLDTADVLLIQKKISGIHVSDALLEYAQDIIDFTRSASFFYTGLSPRAGLALLHTAKSWAFLNGREYVIPEDIQTILPHVIRHRLQSAETLQEYSFERLEEIMKSVAIP